MLQLGIDWNPSPEIVNIFGLSIRYYGLMFVIAFLLGLKIMKKFYKNEGVSEEYIDPLFMYVVLATLIGARLGEVFFYSWDSFKHRPLEIFLPIAKDANGTLFGFIEGWTFTGFTGLASHGAIIGIIVALFLYRRKYIYKSVLWIIDRVAIPAALGSAFVRFGNLMNSEIIGKVTNSNFGFRFIRDHFSKREAMSITNTNDYEKAYDLIGSSVKYKHYLAEVPLRYPTQILEALSYVCVFLILWFVYWKTDKKEKAGYLFGLFMVLFWSIRFVIEFFKEWQGGLETIFKINLNTGQLLSIPMILVGLYFMFRKSK
ncbi:MAG: prolipoprotein diacylglyceryl transferase [Flavobacteriaceae bacterium]|nr:prolipoprotein diacylglyceryl transferase [Flavobacteriaceae bacterium]